MPWRLLDLRIWQAKTRRELFVREDDWGEIEVLPASCAAWCAAELARIDAFARAHLAPEGPGWTDIYVRETAPQSLAALALSFEHASRALAAQLPAFDAIVSGTFSSPEPVARVRAFGPTLNGGVVLVPDCTAGIVEMISLVLNGTEDECREVESALAAIPASSPLIIIDWQRGTVKSV